MHLATNLRAALLFLLGLTACAAAPGPAAEAPYLLGVHIAETARPADFLEQLDRAAELGARAVRVPVDWAALEPDQKGRLDAAYLSEVRDRFLRAERLGLAAVLLLSQSPAWANGNAEPPYPPKPEHYADFADALVRLVEAVGPERIAAVEVWNEPNSIEFWGYVKPREGTYVLAPLRYAREYAALLNAAYDAMKRRFPELPVLGGSLASADTAYLDAMLAAAARFDHLAVHPYAGPDEREGPHYGRAQYPDQCNEEDPLTPPWCFEQGLRGLRAFLDARGRAETELWITEFGVGSSAEWGDAGSEAEQAKHLRIALGLLNGGLARELRIPVALWYRLRDEGEDRFGLYREDGRLKPAGAAFKELAP